MGLDITFVNPATFKGDNPEEPKLSDYEEKTTLAGDIAILRIIDWLPYAKDRCKTHNILATPYTGIRTNSKKTVKELKAWLIGFREWILDNRNNYIYLPEPKYEWQEKFYANKGRLLFGDIDSINSPVKPTRQDHQNTFMALHTIYRTDGRPISHFDMIHDSMLVQNFIDMLEEQLLDDSWIVMFH